ncbi:MAG: hypothetical protein ABIP71_12730 [Verrucomicrobiota bacterium]
MKLARLPHNPTDLLDFFSEGLEAMGAVCERTWYDRLQIVAESDAAKLWNENGALFETEIHFPPADDVAPRQAATEVFPGCPLTFRLAEKLRPTPLPLQRACLNFPESSKPPSPEVAEKLWHAQMPQAGRWKQETPFVAGWHFSLLTLAHCEIQAIDQHWSLHRIAVSLPDGRRDEPLADALHFAPLNAHPPDEIAWPTADPFVWQQLLQSVLPEELALDLERIQQRQQNYLRRELERVDRYFENYERELTERARSRSAVAQNKIKTDERLAAARAEHERRRNDQVQRHEIRVIPHFDALLLLAEPAWATKISIANKGESQTHPARFVPRARQWICPA